MKTPAAADFAERLRKLAEKSREINQRIQEQIRLNRQAVKDYEAGSSDE